MQMDLAHNTKSVSFAPSACVCVCVLRKCLERAEAGGKKSILDSHMTTPIVRSFYVYTCLHRDIEQ
jgi:hypothetical protein